MAGSVDVIVGAWPGAMTTTGAVADPNDGAPAGATAGVGAAADVDVVAPELLAALQMAMPALEWCEKQWAKSPQHGEGVNVLAVARAALTKAEGV